MAVGSIFILSLPFEATGEGVRLKKKMMKGNKRGAKRQTVIKQTHLLVCQFSSGHRARPMSDHPVISAHFLDELSES